MRVNTQMIEIIDLPDRELKVVIIKNASMRNYEMCETHEKNASQQRNRKFQQQNRIHKEEQNAIKTHRISLYCGLQLQVNLQN